MAETYDTLVIFGATGDLAHRMLFPSLYNLMRDGMLPAGMMIVGSGRTEMDEAAFRDDLRARLADHLPADRFDEGEVDRFLATVRYCPASIGEAGSMDALVEVLGDRRDRGFAVYLSTPPSLFGPVVQGLADAGLAGEGVRLALEKPIGKDLASSREVNDGVNAVFDEDRVFRVDHYLGKETVQNLLVLRFGNTLFEPLWNANAIDHVQITVAETVGLEGRVSYYDGVGALKDMVQNHLLQLLALVAMEAPASTGSTAVRDEKVKVLRSLRKMSADDVGRLSVRGQYRAGAVSGKAVPGYTDELGERSGTETFVALKAHIDNWRWAGVPFYLRTGKRMAERKSEIYIQFKPVPHSIFDRAQGALQSNAMVINVQPKENIQVLVMAKQPSLDRDGLKLREVPLDVSLSSEASGSRRRIAYERLLLDLLEGDNTLFVRRDEVEAAWGWIDSIRDAWSEAGQDVKQYMAGSWGPDSSVAMIERGNASWHE